MKRTIWRSKPGAGMTLAELLVAMMILMVGIYAVVRGFPPLFRNIEAERVRTEMARLAESTLERLKSQSERLPEATTGHDPVTWEVINPGSEPDESASVQEGNAHDDIRWVLGETIEVPAPDVSGGYSRDYSAYPLNLGPAASQEVEWPPGSGTMVWAMQGAARELTALTRLDEAPMGAVPDGTFYLAPDGTLELPSDYDAAMVDYCWVQRSGEQHWVWDEYTLAGDQIRAAAIDSGSADPSDFANVIPTASKARGVVEYYPIVVGDAGDVGPNPVVLESGYGATLLFDDTLAGRVFQLDYALKSYDDANGNPRRTPMVMEERPAPTVAPYTLDLQFRNLDDETPLYDQNMEGVAVDDVLVLIVDTQDGSTWSDNDDFVSVDVVEGRVTLDWADASSPMTADQARGHELRVYYRTLDRHNIQVIKAPRWFVEDVVAVTYDPSHTYYVAGTVDAVDYRVFSASTTTVGTDEYTTLTFPESMAGEAVAVDYLCGTAAPSTRVPSELHVVDGTTFQVVLSEANVQAIVAVQGVSLTVRGWWETERGRVQKLDLNTHLTPASLL